MKIPFYDLARLHASIRAELDEAIDEVLRTSRFVGGPFVTSFEEQFAAAHGAPAAAGCGSGTDALALALRALGVGPGDEVIVPSMTFVATAEAVRHVGATPVVADVDPSTLLLDELSVDAVRTPAARAVIPVHLYGHLVPFELLQHWRESGLLVIEDAAQAHLAADGDSHVGSVSNAACFSFFPGKNLGGIGDGGLVLSHDENLVAEIRRLRDHGRVEKFRHDVPGWCSRLDALNAAILSVKLRHLPEWTEQRRRLADRYSERLGELLVPWRPGAVHHLLVVRVPSRTAVQTRLAEQSIGTGIHYPIPLSRQPWLEGEAAPAPNAETAANEVLSLPMDPMLSLDEVDEVCDALIAVLHSVSARTT
ncbi:MAG: DegT/DnrJ/EryC1/StrS family aminotransferase [Acidimicrobiales bacterium]|nr:DegT/DnrJ/EryC1/StrS family aminotransferase [Acidimicrobiales bacterium]